MNTEITYTITTKQNDKKEEITFKVEYDTNGNQVDGYSYNPTSGWTNYTNFTQGWSEEDPELQEMLMAIKDYSQSMDLDMLIADSTTEDIGNTITTEYYCDGYVTENKTYSFTITIDDVTYTGDVLGSLSTTQIAIVKEAIEKQYEVEVDEEDFHEYLDLAIEDAEQINEFNQNTWGFLKQGILEDYSKCL